MIDIETARQLALALPGVVELPHFEKASFRLSLPSGKPGKIFATLDTANQRACLMLSLIDQSVFCAYDKSIIYPVPNKWGKQGATFVELKKVRKSMFKDALTQAYEYKKGKGSAGK